MTERSKRDAAVAVIREFIVAAVGEDIGEAMTTQAGELADALASAGLLASTEPAPDDVVETVAKAICNAGRDYDRWADRGHLEREDLRDEARAAIAAMPKPAVSREQVEIMAINLHDLDCGGPFTGMHHDDHWKAWLSSVEYALGQASVPVQDGEQRHG